MKIAFRHFRSMAFVAALFALIALPAAAQNGFDLFSIPRTITIIPTTVTTAGITNVIDLAPLTGIGKLDIVASTNAASTSTVTLLSSTDNTNWFLFTNYAKATAYTVNYTNSGNLANIATNRYMLPGTTVTPTTSTSGFASSYLLPAAFTGTGGITVTNQPIVLGVVIDNSPRYLAVGCAATATSTFGVTLTARGKTTGVP